MVELKALVEQAKRMLQIRNVFFLEMLGNKTGVFVVYIDKCSPFCNVSDA